METTSATKRPLDMMRQRGHDARRKGCGSGSAPVWGRRRRASNRQIRRVAIRCSDKHTRWGALNPSVHNLKWWMTASMLRPSSDARWGHNFAVVNVDRDLWAICSSACSMMRRLCFIIFHAAEVAGVHIPFGSHGHVKVVRPRSRSRVRLCGCPS
jgi:hypothetical protein